MEINNGLIINFGYGNNATITFPLSYKSKRSIVLGHKKGSGWTNGANANYHSETLTGFYLYQCDGNGAGYIAIGF